jgi:hypothetical protein
MASWSEPTIRFQDRDEARPAELVERHLPEPRAIPGRVIGRTIAERPKIERNPGHSPIRLNT